MVVKQLAAEFQIQLTAELVNALGNFLRLKLQILVVVKSYLHSPVLVCANIRIILAQQRERFNNLQYFI